MHGQVHLCDYLIDAAARDECGDDATALFSCRGAVTSAQRACQRVQALSAALSELLQLQPGDRVCVLAHTTPDHLEALLAVTAAGCVAAPLNWRWSPEEATYAANLVGAQALIADAPCASLACAVAAACPAIVTLVVLGQQSDCAAADLAAVAAAGLRVEYTEALYASHAAPATQFAPWWAPEGAALLVFTSGTTGSPRAALLSHAAVHVQCMNKLQQCGYSASDIYLHAAPLFHVGGICSALAMLLAGARHVFLPAFSAPAALATIAQQNVTSFIAVPAMVADLVAAAPPGAVYPTVTTILVGAGGLSSDLPAALGRIFPKCTLISAYGMTEACSSLAFHTLLRPTPTLWSAESADGAECGVDGAYVGRPPPGIEVGILCPGALEMGGTVSAEGSGEIVTRGAHLMLRYWRDAAATAAVSLPGGWFSTGDLGCIQQGRVWLLGRAKDLIKSGGENVAAWEVERCLASHPAVAAAAVVGVPDQRLGEAVAAMVVLAAGWSWKGAPCRLLFPGGDCQVPSSAAGTGNGPARDPATGGGFVDGAALQRHCRQQRLAGFKLPRAVVVASELPTNATGKVVKTDVRQAFILQIEAQRKGVAPGPPPRPRL